MLNPVPVDDVFSLSGLELGTCLDPIQLETVYAHEASLTAPAKVCTGEDGRIFCDFLLSLQWHIHREVSIAYVELCHLFAYRKYTLSCVEPKTTFGQLVRVLKRWCDIIFSVDSQTLLPGVHSRDDSHPCGWALPRGVIWGARPFFSKEELRAFALKLLDGGARTLKSWDFYLDCYCGN